MENDYLIQERAQHDKRSTRIKLSDKGLKLCQRVDELYQRNIEALTGNDISKEDLEATNASLLQLERFWTDYMNHIYR